MAIPTNNPEQNETEYGGRTTICAPNCPNLGRPYPHTPHIPLYPTDWCRELENHGVIEVPPRDTDFQAQGLTGIQFTVKEIDGNWLKYFGNEGEKQHGVYFDSCSCVTFSAIRVICLQINRMIKLGLLPVEVMQYLQNNGYLDEKGLFSASERFTAKMSGTTRMGNYFTAVWDSIRKDGLLPQKDWDFPTEQRTPVFDWDMYFSEIPQELKDKAKGILKYLSFAYEWVLSGQQISPEARVALLQQHLQHAPLQIASPVCRGWNEGDSIPVPNCGLTTAQHATAIVSVTAENNYIDIDSYIPYVKQLATDYPFLSVLKGVVELTEQTTEQPKVNFDKFDITKAIVFGQRGESVRRLQIALITLNYLSSQYATGFFWTKTQAALLQFQKDNQVDAIEILEALNGKRAGVKTLTKLNTLLWP